MSIESQINNMIFQSRPDLSFQSIKTYSSCISKILELLKSDNIGVFYEKPKEVINIINESYKNNNTCKTKLASCIVLLKCFENNKNKELDDKITNSIKLYLENIETHSEMINNNNSKNEKSERQQEGWLSEEEIEKLKEILKSKVPKTIKTVSDLKAFRDYVLFLFYDTIPSRAELADTLIVNKNYKKFSPEYNYIILDSLNNSAMYILNTYKTFKTYGQKQIVLDSLYNILKKYKSAVDKFNNNHYFLLNDSGSDKITRNRLSVVYSNIGEPINKKLGLSINRHVKVSQLVPIEKMKMLSEVMGNSIPEQITVYSKKD